MAKVNVYSLDMSGRFDTQIFNFTHPDNPTAEKFEADALAAFESLFPDEDSDVDETPSEEHVSNEKLMVQYLEKAGYVRAVTITYLYEEGVVFEE